MAVRTHKFRGTRYRLKLGHEWRDDTKGETDTPENPKPEIRIRKGMEGLMLLDTLIHEGLHACLWDLDDDAVGASASDIARLLWRLGYRKQSTEQ